MLKIQIAHSPDADDAFMFYALTQGKIPTNGVTFENVLCDIETLNHEALKGTYDFTALSVAAVPEVAQHYRISPVGASVGDNYGPMVVAREPLSLNSLRHISIAVPGKKTTAFLALQLLLGNFSYVVIPFDQIVPSLLKGQVTAGLLIHEGQLTYLRQQLYKVVDLGQWWFQKTGLPLPLGVNGIKRSLPKDLAQKSITLLSQSIDYALKHRDQALSYALRFSRNLPPHLADRFVGMYVNHHTVQMGDSVKKAIALLLHQGYQRGFLNKALEASLYS